MFISCPCGINMKSDMDMVIDRDTDMVIDTDSDMDMDIDADKDMNKDIKRFRYRISVRS
jgi:hypothetical protein